MKVPNAGWLQVRQAARRLGVSRAEVYRLIDTGDLPAYRIGPVIRLRVAEVEAYRRQR